MLLDKEIAVPALPYGETLRPLILASSLKRSDLRFVLQRRGIFVKSSRNDVVVPILTSILLSPQEFEILRNRQRIREDTPKMSDAKVDWASDKTVVEVIPDDLEGFVRDLVDDDESYKLKDCSVQTIDFDHVVVNCVIERLDWTKDAFSSTTHHNASFSISRDASSNVVTYHTETTVPETKELMVRLQKSLHKHFREEKVVASNAPIQRVLANHFFDNKFRYEFLRVFIEQNYDDITFQRIVDIDAGIDHNCPNFPNKFSWLKDNVDAIELRGKGIHLTEIFTKLGEIGGLVFGEIYAEFKFDYSGARGTCVIGYGFPRYYDGKSTEFEVKITSLSLYPDYMHVPKERVRRHLLQHFQENKHSIFDKFVKQKKADPRPRTTGNQYYLFPDDNLK